MLVGRQPRMYFQFLSSLFSQTIYTEYPNPMDMAYSPSGRYPVFIFNTVYTAYSLNEYSVYDTCINTAYPGEWIWLIDFMYSFRTLEAKKNRRILMENLQI
ncbi:hypothetical protein Tco_1462628 [Tanacetum coccineum]